MPWNAKFTLQAGPDPSNSHWTFGLVPYEGNSAKFGLVCSPLHAAVKRVLKQWTQNELFLLQRTHGPGKDQLKNPEMIVMMRNRIDVIIKTRFFKRERLTAISDLLTRLDDHDDDKDDEKCA